ncbi:hypothetical protein [Emticicia oligotrophica]|uniref:hypothetical protein n=1 Tax=Emticicia oligotrophica TaxID=312279 RepID=UPI00273B4819|nr:hypothetical protein [Emticicia oligotrophica]
MKKFITTAVFLLTFFQVIAQQNPLLDASNRWILVNNKIEKNEVFLTSYKKAKVKLNTLVLSFAENGKIVYDYETNSKYAENPNIKYLDINTKESSWAYDTLTKTLTLTIQAGYITIDDFKFQREYKIDEVNDGYILMKTKQVFYEDLRKKPVVINQVKKTIPSPIAATPKVVTENKVINEAPKVVADTIKHLVTSNVTEVLKVDSFVKNTSTTDAKIIASIEKEKVSVVVEPAVIAPVKVNYLELHKALFDKTKRWILVRNKIERGDIYLTPYHESKLTINNLVLNLSESGTIEYDYESDPKVKFCAGVDFLDIDTDETSWVFDADNNIFTLTLKGGYASLDDFKFKRDYTVEAFDDGFALRRVKEHYFNDFRKPIKTTGNYQKRRK